MRVWVGKRHGQCAVGLSWYRWGVQCVMVLRRHLRAVLMLLRRGVLLVLRRRWRWLPHFRRWRLRLLMRMRILLHEWLRRCTR